MLHPNQPLVTNQTLLKLPRLTMSLSASSKGPRRRMTTRSSSCAVLRKVGRSSNPVKSYVPSSGSWLPHSTYLKVRVNGHSQPLSLSPSCSHTTTSSHNIKSSNYDLHFCTCCYIYILWMYVCKYVIFYYLTYTCLYMPWSEIKVWLLLLLHGPTLWLTPTLTHVCKALKPAIRIFLSRSCHSEGSTR